MITVFSRVNVFFSIKSLNRFTKTVHRFSIKIVFIEKKKTYVKQKYNGLEIIYTREKLYERRSCFMNAND